MAEYRSGGNYVPKPRDYDGVNASISTFSARTNPSGGIGSETSGWFFRWELPRDGVDGGFSGSNWHLDVVNSPCYLWEGFESSDDVVRYIEDNGNLDAVFKKWEKFIAIDENGSDYYSKFLSACSGCVDKIL